MNKNLYAIKFVLNNREIVIWRGVSGKVLGNILQNIGYHTVVRFGNNAINMVCVNAVLTCKEESQRKTPVRPVAVEVSDE